MKVAFIMTKYFMMKPINPESMFTDSRGMSGSDISLVMYALELSSLGHQVTIFANFSKDVKIGNCEFLDMSKIVERYMEHWDVAISYIDPTPLKFFKCKRILNQQCNDFAYCPGWEEYIDIITSPSETHRQFLKDQSSFSLDKWKILPNGCDPTLYTNRNNDKPRKNRMIYASSPDRALHWVLELFPKVKEQIPDVELHVYYHFNSVYDRMKDGNHEMAQRIRYCNYALQKLKGHGVFHHQEASRVKIAEVFNESKILCYPADCVRFSEGFSNTTLEAAVSGCLPIICGSDSLNELYGEYVPSVFAPYNQHKEQFLNMIIRAFKENDYYSHWQAKSQKLADIYNWKRLVQEKLLPLLQ